MIKESLIIESFKIMKVKMMKFIPIKRLPESPIKTFAGGRLNFRNTINDDSNKKIGGIISFLSLIYNTNIKNTHWILETVAK